MKLLNVFLLVILSFGLLFSCGKDENPYDNIDRPTDGTPTNQPYDTASITGLHQFFLKDKCAIPSCHGGTFEPDFRTPQASYSTLVWQPVIKNTEDYRFRYRVVPGDVAMSWLHERCISDDPILGRMPRYADALSEKELSYLKKWIKNGALDIDGKVPVKPDLNIQCWGYGLWIGDNNLDTTRTDWASPFIFPANETGYLVPYIYDDETATIDFKQVKVKTSKDPNDFSNGKTYSCIYNPTYDNWYAIINSNDFILGTRYYIRITAQDNSHTTTSEQPNANTPNYTLRHYSFIVQ
jgi:hypothetical protein